MKDLKVSLKLIISFLIVLAMTIGVGIVGIIGMQNITKADTEMYEKQTVPMQNMALILETMQMMRVAARDYVVGSVNGDQAKIDAVKQSVADDNKLMQENFDLYYASIIDPAAKELFSNARKLYEGDYLDFLDKSYTLAKAGQTDQLLDELDYILPTINDIVNDFKQCFDMKVDRAKGSSDSNNALANRMLVLIIVVLAAVSVIALALAFYISGLISKPLLPLVTFMKKASSIGDIILSKEDKDVIGKYAQRKDEIGQVIASTAAFVDRIEYVSDELEAVAGGDLTSEVKLLSDRDIMGDSLHKMVDSLNDMFGEINSSTEQVTMGANQVADGAQALAQGSTEQAASVEELSSSIAEIAEKTKNNADMAMHAANLASTIKANAEKGNQQMDEMMDAVKEINQASQNISKVIKVIDDIAFQTNILALNAAVEAARAGQHGKGFAVVAEEVRNLAAKSAEAAKETGVLIQNSMEKAELGAKIAGETAASLIEIVSGINESDEIVNKIANLSNEQADEIKQINEGIDQVAQVIQQNSATAEESAAASEEMSGQSNMLKQLISQFSLKDKIYH